MERFIRDLLMTGSNGGLTIRVRFRWIELMSDGGNPLSRNGGTDLNAVG